MLDNRIIKSYQIFPALMPLSTTKPNRRTAPPLSTVPSYQPLFWSRLLPPSMPDPWSRHVTKSAAFQPFLWTCLANRCSCLAAICHVFFGIFYFIFCLFVEKLMRKNENLLYTHIQRGIFFFFVWSLDHLVAYILIMTLKMLRFINLNSSFLA